jgi:hypothetical protein
MATDPPTTPDPASIQQAADATSNLADAQTKVAETSPAATNGVNGFVDSSLKVVANSPKVIAAMLGISQASANFTAGIDSNKIITLNSQLDKLAEVAKRPGTGLETLASGLTNALKKMGGDSGKIDGLVASFGKNLAGLVPQLIDYAKNIAKVGDSQKVIGMGMIEQGAAAGSLGTILARSKDGLQDFGKLAQEQQQVWDKTSKATGITKDELAKYSAVLNKVPGVMNQLIDSHDHGKASSENFTKTMNLMQISGRNYADITKDMTTVTMELGTSVAGATDYTARMSLAADKLGVPFETLHAAIASSTAAFKMFATGGKAADDMAKNLEASMSGYIAMLKGVGVPMGNAIEMAQNFAGAINQMSIGQKAFLSQQTGGPGGLMGAFQLDKLMDEGKIDQVFGKAQDALRKQFGRIVTTKEAATSQAAAEQMTRQMMILKQGPLGQFAKTDAEARRVLDGMASGKSGADLKNMTADMKKDAPLENLYKAGNKISQGSQNLLSQIAQLLGEAETTAVGGTAKSTQQLSARQFNRVGEGAGNPALQANLRDNQRRGTSPGSGSPVENLTRDLKGLPETLKLTLSTLGKAISSGNRDSIRSADEKLQKSIADYKNQASMMSGTDKKATLDSAKTITETANKAVTEAIRKSVMATPPGAQTTNAGAAEALDQAAAAPEEATDNPALARAKAMAAMEPGTKDNKERAVPPGQMVRQAAQASTGGATAPGTTGTRGGAAHAPGAHPMQGGHGGQPVAVTLAPGTAISVNFNGTCPHCGTHVSTTESGKFAPQATK